MSLELKGKKTLSELLELFEDKQMIGKDDFSDLMNHAQQVLSEDESKKLCSHFFENPRCGAVLTFSKINTR